MLALFERRVLLITLLVYNIVMSKTLAETSIEYSVLNMKPLDLHVLGTPPAFVLSQDQTLKLKFICFADKSATQ